MIVVKHCCRIAAPLLATGLIVVAGCGGPKPEPPAGTKTELSPADVARMPTQPNVVNVLAIYNPYTCWIWNPDKSRVRGVRVGSLYLIGPDYTGVFGDGVIRPRVYVMERDDDGRKVPKLVKEWSLDVAQAVEFRAKKKTKLGWGYGLFLDWGDLDLGGREIRVVIAFERGDGQVVTSKKTDLMVPRSGG